MKQAGRESSKRTRTRAASQGALPNKRAALADLAAALNNLSNVLVSLGRYEDALAACAEAVDIRRQLANLHDDSGLSGALNNLSAILNQLGRYEEALAASTETVERRRKLVTKAQA